MSSDKVEPLSDLWTSRFDDRDDEELAHQVWVQQMSQRDQAIAQPIRGFVMPDEQASDLAEQNAANDSTSTDSTPTTD
jgi:hypothetical protein